MKIIGEEIEVIVWFKEGKITPIRFKWEDKAIKVDQIIFRDRKGSSIYDNLTIRCQSFINDKSVNFDLLYNTTNYKWKLLKIY